MREALYLTAAAKQRGQALAADQQGRAVLVTARKRRGTRTL